jgi:hypothetical protein
MEIRFWMTVAGILFGAACALAQTTSQDIHVAVNGNDAWSGKLAEPNADKTDGPFQSAPITGILLLISSPRLLPHTSVQTEMPSARCCGLGPALALT